MVAKRIEHSKRFAFKQPESWGQPDEEMEFEDESWGQVRLRRWDNLHDKRDADTILAVIYAEVHRDREKPPAPLWLDYKLGHTRKRVL